MKSIFAIIALSCVIGVAFGHHLYGGALVAPAAVPVAVPWAASIPSSRFSRSDWIQPGQTIAIPAVAKYNTITPGFTTLHASSVPIVGQAPIVAAAAHHW